MDQQVTGAFYSTLDFNGRRRRRWTCERKKNKKRLSFDVELT
jgi:hypothetical protein